MVAPSSSFPPSLLRHLYRRIYWAPKDARYWRELWQIQRLVYLGGGGIGDSLNCSAVLHELQKRGGLAASIMSPHPELFAGNPLAASVHHYDHDLVVALQRWSRSVKHPIYGIPQEQPPRSPVPEDHIVTQLCRSVGLSGEVSLRPYFHFLRGERERFAEFRGAVVVQSSCLHARHALPAKNWPVAHMQAVVDALRHRYRIIQTGHPDDSLLQGAEDLRGRHRLREVAALLSQAHFFVGLVGFLMHLARAVETRSVIIYGGREHPLQSGYSANENIIGPMPCAPCGLDGDCPVGHGCMTQIQPDHVLNAVERLERRLDLSLECATANI